jgi:hypothetical protein
MSEQDSGGWTVTRYDSFKSNDVTIVVTFPMGERHERTLNDLDDEDYQALRIAGIQWSYGDRCLRLGDPLAGLTFHCLAIERLFPHLREELPG